MSTERDLKARADQLIPDDALDSMPPHLRERLEASTVQLCAFYQREYRTGQGLIRRFVTKSEALIAAVRARGADATTEALAAQLEAVIADARKAASVQQGTGDE